MGELVSRNDGGGFMRVRVPSIQILLLLVVVLLLVFVFAFPGTPQRYLAGSVESPAGEHLARTLPHAIDGRR